MHVFLLKNILPIRFDFFDFFQFDNKQLLRLKVKLSAGADLMLRAFPWLCYIPGVAQICEALEKEDRYRLHLLPMDISTSQIRNSNDASNIPYLGSFNIHPSDCPSNIYLIPFF